MTYTLRLELVEDDTDLRIAIINETEDPEEATAGFEDILNEWHAWTGHQPEELDT